MIKVKYTLGYKSKAMEFETIEQLLEYERAQKGESYQSLPESFDKDAFRDKVDEIKAGRWSSRCLIGVILNGNPIDNAVKVEVDYISGMTSVLCIDGREIIAPNHLVTEC